MRDDPPAELVTLLDELQLVSPAVVAAARGRVRRLAGGLTPFASVWVDALVEAHTLTPWQAAEINSGRGAELSVGPYLLRQRLPSSGWASAYLGHDRDTGTAARLLIADCSSDAIASRAAQAERLLSSIEHVACPGVALPTRCGRRDDQLWCAYPATSGGPAAAWCARRGRLAPTLVAELARQMAGALAGLDRFELVHADVSTHTLWLDSGGQVALTDALFRALARPVEGFAHLDVAPEALDYLAPERARDGAAPSRAADIYASGLVWWHLLTGRPPLSGGDSLTKLQAACAPRIAPVNHLAPDTPRPLATAIARCLALDPMDRPQSFAELAADLGRPTAQGRRELTVARHGVDAHDHRTLPPGRRTALAACAGVGLLSAALLFAPEMQWLPWHDKRPIATAPGPAPQPAAANEPASAPPLPVASATHVDEAPQILIDGNLVRLPAGRVTLDRLKLRSGQTVAPPPGTRCVCVVGPQGFVIEGAQVRLENIDFVHSGATSQRANLPPLVALHGPQATFVGCTFTATAGERTLGAAIAWRAPSPAAGQPLTVARLDLENCIVRAARHAVVVEHSHGAGLIWRNCLHLGPGPALGLLAPPRFESPIAFRLQQSTLREADGLVEIAAGPTPSFDGTLRIEYSQTVFAPPAGSALVGLHDERAANAAPQSILFRGDSSVVQPGVMLVAWRDQRRVLHPLREEELSAQGLVRGAIEFAGPARRDPAASLLTRWQVPLVAEEPPGIDPRRLPELP